MAGPHSVSDLVRDSKIETEWLGSCFRHTFYDTGPSAKQRRVRREERWVRQKFVGQGAYGRVYLEQCEHGSSQKLRAVKEIKKAVTLGDDLDYMRELEAVAKFSNQKYSHCFVRSHGWFELEDSIFISMEYLANGDLQRYLTAPMKEYEARQITSQVLEGLTFMHDNGFVHRDLKPGNIMVVSTDPEWFVKITDFGVSKRRQQNVTTLHTMQRGTMGFVAPEVLELLPEKSSSYTFSVDMWSLGAVIYMILTNVAAFQNYAELFKFSNGMSAFPTHPLENNSASNDAQDFVLQLMKPSPKDRLSAGMAAHHPWMLANAQNNTTSDGTGVESRSVQMPIGTNLTPDSMASKAWSMISYVIPTSSVESSPMEVIANKSETTETFITVNDDHVEKRSLNTTIGPLASGARGRLEYEKPSTKDVLEDQDSYPKLPADSPFVLENVGSSNTPFVSEAMKTSKSADPAKLDPRVTIETDTAHRIEIQNNQPLESSDNGREHDGGDHLVPNGSVGDIETYSSDFNMWLLPQCVAFSTNPPKEKKKREAEHRRLSGMVMQFLVKLDEIKVGGDLEMRSKRKQLVSQVQTVEKGIDQICQKIIEGRDRKMR